MDDEDCAKLDENCAALEVGAIADEDCAAFTIAESLTDSDEELLTAGVICNELDDDTITHIVFSDELDSGTYRLIWYSCANIESAAMQTKASVLPRFIKMLYALYYSPLGAAFFTKRRGLNSRGGNSNLILPLTSVR